MGLSLKELYDNYKFLYDRDPKRIDTNTPTTLDIDIEQNKKWLNETPKIYGTDIVRIMSGGQVDKDKVRGVVGKIAGKSKLGGFVKKLIAPTAFKPSDLIQNGQTTDPLYLGIEQNGSFGGSIIKSVKQYLKDNKTQANITSGARGLLQDIAVDGLKMLGNKVLGKLGIGKVDSDAPSDARKISSIHLGKKELIFPSTIVIHQNKNVGGVISNQEQNYFVDGIELNNVFTKRITIGSNFKPLIDDEAIGKEANKKLDSATYFIAPTMYKYNSSGGVGMQNVPNYEEYIKNENNKSILLKQRKDFSHNIRSKFLEIDANQNQVLILAGPTITKKTKLPSSFPLIGTLDGKEPDAKPKVDIYGQNNGGINNFSQSLLDSGRRVDQSYFGSGSINVNNQINTGALVSTPELSTGSFTYKDNKDIFDGDSSTIGDVEKKISRVKVLKQRYKDLKPVDVKLTLPKYNQNNEAHLNTSKQTILSRAPINLTVNIGGISFPSTITGFSDSVTPNWDSVAPIGAGVPFYVFNNVEREISFTMTLYAENAEGVQNIKEKANAVGKMAWSKRSGYGAYGNIISLRIGNLIQQKGFLSTFTLKVEDTHPWDTKKELPMVVSIDIAFKVATNNDTDSYNLYGFSPSATATTGNDAPPGAKEETKATTATAVATKPLSLSTIDMKSLNTTAPSDTTRNVPMEQVAKNAQSISTGKVKKTIGG